MARFHLFPELTSITGDERLYAIDDPAGTPLDRYVDIATLDLRWAPINGEFNVNTVATTGATEELTSDPGQDITMDQNCTFSFPSITNDGFAFALWLKGAFTPTFPGAVVWADGSAPTYVDDSLFVFQTYDSGTTWIGSLVGSALA